MAPAGVISIVKIAAYVFGSALVQASFASHALLVLCGGGAALAALIAISKQDLNERLAYVCAAQNLSALVGALLALPAGLFAATLQVAAVCCAGSTMIMASGAVFAVTGRTKAPDYVGLGRVMPWTLGGFAVGCAGMIGMPPFAGAWAKLWLITASAGAGLIWAAGLLGAAAILTFAALGPLAANALAGKAPADAFKRPDGASIFLGRADCHLRRRHTELACAGRWAGDVSFSSMDAARMSGAPRRPRVRAGLGLTLLFSMASLLIGTGLDFATASGQRFWIDEQPGALALLGAGDGARSGARGACRASARGPARRRQRG